MTARLTVAARTDIGRVRSRNEDAFLVTDLTRGDPPFENGLARFEIGPRGALIAVSDGMGGHKAGDVASTMTLAELQNFLVTRGSNPDAGERLVNATERANEAVYKAGRRPSKADMGATLTAVLVDGARAHVAQIGDSRAYVIRDGQIARLTQDQTFAEAVVQSGALSPSEMEESPLRNVLLQAVGHAPDVRAAVGVLSLRRRDCLVLCSDGLTKELDDDEIRGTILSAPSLASASATLVDRANAHGGADNVTVVLVGVNGDLPTPEPAEGLAGTYRVVSSAFGNEK
jgi:serine/threonine protein phosphatase PrpC